MSLYAKGRRYEWKVRDHLHEAGFTVVRAAGSKGDSKIDLIALHPDGRVLFVQCKKDGFLPPGEWNRLVEVARWSGALPVVASGGGAHVGLWLLTAMKIPRSRTYPMEIYIP